MKKLKLSLVLMMAMAAGLVMTGCGDNGDDDDPSPKPTLNFLGGSEYVSADITLQVSTAFKVGIEASHESRMSKLEISVSYNGGPRVSPEGCTMCDSSINTKSLSVVYNGITNSNEGTETWYFAVVDKDGKKTEKSFTITTEGLPIDIANASLTLGNQDASEGSSLRLDILDVLTLDEAKTNSDKIDVIYVYDDTEGHIICAPSANVAADKLTGTNGVSSWSTRNASKMRLTAITETEFNNMTDNALLSQERKNMTSASAEVKDVKQGDVLIVTPVSSGGRDCLILIETINMDNTIIVNVAYEDI